MNQHLYIVILKKLENVKYADGDNFHFKEYNI